MRKSAPAQGRLFEGHRRLLQGLIVKARFVALVPTISVAFHYRVCVGGEFYSGKFICRSRSSKRGSERSGSRKGLTFRWNTDDDRSVTARSSHSKA